MKHLRGLKAVLTGASGGIGVFLAEALAREGMDVLLVAYPGVGLGELAESVSKPGLRATILESDLREPGGCLRVVEVAQEQFGRVDLLVNNAGVEYSRPFHELSSQQVRDVVAVNLEAPLELTRLVLPGMLDRHQGHIVSLSSLAGKSGPAFQEPYAATKAALTAFTFSLRSSYRGTGVSASVVCPGFVEAGIYARLKERSGSKAPWLLAGCRPEQVAKAVVRAIRQDRPEILVNRFPIGIVLALAAYAPTFGAWLSRHLGVDEFFRKVAEAEKRRAPPLPAAINAAPPEGNHMA
jgi:short-subunit dehydrogenase